eukprot:1248814-Pyramimonas_sp.AAC.1
MAPLCWSGWAPEEEGASSTNPLKFWSASAKAWPPVSPSVEHLSFWEKMIVRGPSQVSDREDDIFLLRDCD